MEEGGGGGGGVGSGTEKQSGVPLANEGGD